MIALTYDEVRRLFTTLLVEPAAPWLAHCHSHDGDAAISIAPEPAIFRGSRPHDHDNRNFRLE
jgi:hypothetical protein